MGSFTSTCAISHLPISDNDEVVMLLLKDRASDKCNCGVVYSDDLWEPKYLPVYGIYDSYGRVDKYNRHNWNVKLIEETEGKPLLPKDRFSKEDSIQGMIHQRKSPLGIMMCHRWAYETLTKSTSGYPDDITMYDMGEYAKKFYTSLKALKDDADAYEVTRHYERSEKTEEYERNDRYSAMMRFSQYKSITKIYVNHLIELSKTADFYPETVLLELSRYILFKENFQKLSRVFHPQVLGSEGEMVMDLHRKLLVKSLNYIENFNERCDE